MSPEVHIAVETMRKAFERIEALGVNVKAAPPALPGPTKPYVIQMKDLCFEQRGANLLTKELSSANS